MVYFYNKGVKARAAEIPEVDHSEMYNPFIMFKERHPRLTPEQQEAHDKALEPEKKVDMLRSVTIDSLKKEIKHDAHKIALSIKVKQFCD
jgi:hypothetical protein